MPSPTTGLDIIRGALNLTNALGVDQTPTASEVSDCLEAFNDLIEIFNTSSLAVYGSANQTFNTVAGQATYTMGTGGDWSTVRPVQINDPAYTVINSTSYPVYSMTQAEYNAIPVKTQPQPFAYRYLYVNSFPLGLLTLWPVPSEVAPITFSIDNQLTAISSAATSISFPPGYAMVFRYKLAIMLAPLFGRQMSQYPDVMRIATESFAEICRANKTLTVMQYPYRARPPNYPDFIAGAY
jgi:hypothetical protein